MTTVVIIQEYVPQYRVAFFDQLGKIAAAEGIEVKIAAGRPNSKQLRRADGANPLHVTHIAQREFSIAGRRIVLRNILKATRGADLVVLEQGRRNLDVYSLFLPRFMRKAPRALWGHGRDYVEKRSKFAAWIQMRLTARADWFFAYTPGGAAHVEALPFADDRITVVMNSIDTVALRGSLSNVRSTDIANFRRRWDVKGRIACFIGALDESKRIPFLLESIRILNKKHSDLAYVIAGDGPLLEKLKLEAADLPNVRFIGRVYGQDKNVLLAASDLLLVPGRVGLVAVDSLAAGVPIATTQWQFHAPEFEYLVPEATSVISANSVLDYANAISDLFSDEQKLELLANGSRMAGESLSIDRMAQNFLEGIMGALREGVKK